MCNQKMNSMECCEYNYEHLKMYKILALDDP